MGKGPPSKWTGSSGQRAQALRCSVPAQSRNQTKFRSFEDLRMAYQTAFKQGVWYLDRGHSPGARETQLES